MGNIISNLAQNQDTSPAKEIVIRCSVEEMMKAFFQDYVIVWHDPNVNSQENQQYMNKIKQFCEVFTFTEWQKAEIFIKESKTLCHVITSGKNGELLIYGISASSIVTNIYVFCGNKAYHSMWSQRYPKISCVETEIEAVLSKLQENLLGWYKEASSIKLNLPAFAPIFNDSDKSEMNHLHRYLKIIPKFKNREQAKDDFVELSRKIYSDQKNVKLIEEFEKSYNEYNKEQILRWYTRESFLCKVANNCLRIATPDSIQYCRLILRDIEQAIKDQYQAKSKGFSGLLYRGAYLTQEEWSHLKENQDKEIEMHGFLSVSKDKNVALDFMKTDPTKKVFITIVVPKGPNEEEQGFAEVEEFSQYSYEKEILFNVRSRFTVLETEDEYIYSGASKCRHLILLYGAQGFRQLIAEKNLFQKVWTPSLDKVSCAHCKVKSAGVPEKVFFVSLADPRKQVYSCKKCLHFGVTPFLCISTILGGLKKASTSRIQGCPLRINLNQEKIPFYGYKCCNCQAKKSKAYFMCTNCDGKENKWCEDCFDKGSKCKKLGHENLILETSPFSFWCEKMSASELNHLKFHKNLVQDSVFQQAQMYFESHKYEKAIEYYSLYIQENEAKGKDANLATSFYNIGYVYDKQGEYQKALEYHFKSLDIRRSVYGNNHATIASSLSEIGSIYRSQGDSQKASEYYLKALEIKKSVHGKSHPDDALFSKIGKLYPVEPEDPKALQYYFRALDIYKSVYGDKHPDIGTCFHSLGLVYNFQGEYNKAFEYFSKALNIRKSVYGDNHPDTINTQELINSIRQNRQLL